MNYQGRVLLNALLELITGLILAPCRLVAWLIRDDGTAAQLDAQAAALRQSSAAIDRSERDPAETLAQIMRKYLRRECRLGSLACFGDEVCAWALAARYEGLNESDVPRDDARFEMHIRGRHHDLSESPLISSASVGEMRQTLRAAGKQRQDLSKLAYTRFSTVEPAPEYVFAPVQNTA